MKSSLRSAANSLFLTQPMTAASALSAVTVALSLALFAVPAAHAQTFTFTDVANSTSAEFSGFGGPGLGVNTTGTTVAFLAFRDAGGSGIYTATNTSAFNAVALTNSSGFSSFNAPRSISSTGTVAFLADRSISRFDNESGIYTANNTSAFTRVAIQDNAEFRSLSDPTTNSAGTVAFRSNRGGTAAGIYSASNTNVLTTVALTESPEFSGFGDPSINSVGLVAFTANRDAGVGGGSGVYTATNTSGFSQVALTTSPEFSGFVFPSINNVGTVAFLANRDVGGSGIYTATNTSAFNALALTTDPEFDSFFSPSINNAGTVAFSAFRKPGVGGGKGIYAALTGVTAPVAVIRTGDPLFGSTVSDFTYRFGGLAEGANVLAFQYTLATGVTGVARVEITPAVGAPEPGSLVLLAVGGVPLVGLVARVARRRKNKAK